VVPAPEPLHGRVRAVEHGGAPLFAGIPARFEATRYHSLCLERPLPDALEEIAWADDGVPMAVAHRTRPQWGVQFHPESIATEHGRRLLANLRDLTRAAPRPVSRGELSPARGQKSPSRSRVGGRFELKARRLDASVDPAHAFCVLYGSSRGAFWLDSSRIDGAARFSFMGDASGPLAATVSYDVAARQVTVEREGTVAEARDESIFDYLERETARLPSHPELPFDFACGFAGYLGYEVKADCGGANAHVSSLPDAALIFADRLIAFDHEQGDTYLLSLCHPETEQAAEDWLSAMESRLLALAARAPLEDLGEDSLEPPRCCDSEPSPKSPRLARSHDQYVDDIAVCLDLLREGESYEICLTNSIDAEVDADPLAVYIELRRVNPAPFASYLRFDDLTVLSSSPERFLAVDRDGRAEAKPIKGTSPRGAGAEEDARLAAHLCEDEKTRAENLMIVDLLRNDLGSVCAVGSVEVPSLMTVESYETVHQLVSTVRGRLRPGTGAVECVRACFPPGSMTGAPKLRTVEILERLEDRPRGVYSGAIGYFGAGGSCDLSVAIRTVVLDGTADGQGAADGHGTAEGHALRVGRARATIGAGGAIVLQSDPEREYEEMLLKAAAPLRAIDPEADLASISLSNPRRAAPFAPPPASAHDLTS
jgi:para-aminobenzoate synthetase